MQSVKRYSLSQVNLRDVSTRLLSLTEDAAYTLTQVNGQRIFRKSPNAWVGPEPSRNCEVFVGRIPHDCFEDTLVPLLMKAGDLFEFRLMINFSGWNRGYAFAMYATNAEAVKAVHLLNNFMIRPSWQLGVCPSLNNCRLFISRIPPNLSSVDIVLLLYTLTEEVKEVLLRRSASSSSTIVEYKSHRGAAMARKMLVSMAAAAWGPGARPAVDWSLPDSPKLLRQYREVGYWTPEHGVVLTRLSDVTDRNGSSAASGASYTLEPWSQARRMRLIQEAQRAAASGLCTLVPIAIADSMRHSPRAPPPVARQNFVAARASLQIENFESKDVLNPILLSDNGAKWANQMVTAYEADGKVASAVPANGVYATAGNGANWAGLGLAPAERLVWAPPPPATEPSRAPPCQFNPWTARLPLRLDREVETLGPELQHGHKE